MNTLYVVLKKHSLFISIGFLLLGFLVFFPNKFIAVDEFDYLRNAELLTQGELKQECIEGFPSQFYQEDFCISKYNIGTSLFFIPAALVNSEVVAFGTTFVLFALGIILFKKTLQLLNINPVYTYLYALYPPFVYYSRTLYSEVFGATILLGAFYALLKLKNKFSFSFATVFVILSSLAVFIRYSNVIIVLALIAWYLWELYGKVQTQQLIQQILTIGVMGIPFITLFVWFNNYLYGSPLRSGYYFSGEEFRFESLSTSLKFIILYTVLLLLMYPGMLLVGMLKRNKRSLVFTALAVFFVLFYSGFETTVFEFRPLDLIFATRFFLPIVPFLLISYSDFLSRFEKWKYFKQFAVIVIIVLILVSVAEQFVHLQYLDGQAVEWPEIFKT